MNTNKASRRRVKQSLHKYKLYTVEELEEKKEPLEIEEDDMDAVVVKVPRRKLNWDDD